MIAQKGGAQPPLGELVFYEKLISDGVAYINTNYIPTTQLRRFYMDIISPLQNNNFFGARNSLLSNNTFVFSVGSANRTALYSIFVRSNVNYVISLAAEGWEILLEDKGDTYDVTTTPKGQSPSLKTLTKSATTPNVPCYLFAVNNGSGITMCNNGAIVKSLDVVDGNFSMKLTPCTYNGEAGMWDKVEGKFYGNANTSGSFSVE